MAQLPSKEMKMHMNTANDITTSPNEAYATTDNVPVVNNQAYGMGHH